MSRNVFKNKSGKDYSESQESDIAKKLSGKTQSNSGGTRFGGGDVHTKQFLIEAKTPTKEQVSFSVKKEWIDKAGEQAFEQGKMYGVVAFRFKPEGDDYYVVSSQLFSELVNHVEEIG